MIQDSIIIVVLQAISMEFEPKTYSLEVNFLIIVLQCPPEIFYAPLDIIFWVAIGKVEHA